ncbi:hypothetical protein JAAARDRAFT_72701 [Jaapia argillacea MUCL 33604]|uniref:Translocon-associated protein subunit alpha n=1 Tax=Jaapia argillacea MUCL 33604 TaxID=933084 RepID=A0A067PPH0_9AGAM|nr:hypothetical protein JAAARDRAFT_72701 [Jaapia argillacea MUCL 33604]
MRFASLFAGLLSVAALSVSVSASIFGESEPEITVTATFPEDNPFHHVVNGEKNRLELIVENKSEKNVTLMLVSGSVHDPETDDLVKNVTTLTYGLRLLAGVKLQVPYTFHSEFKPGDLKLKIWLEHVADDETYRVLGYDSIITVVEPELSVFDFKLISTYLMLIAILGGLSYVAYQTFAPAPKKSRKPKPAQVSAPVTVTATGAGGYQEEWIPEHHLKKAAKVRKVGVVSSGDELETSGAETSGNEGKRRKGRK